MRTNYYINNNDKVYDVSFLPDMDIVKKYIVNNYTEISYDELEREFNDTIYDERNYILRNDYYPELYSDCRDIEYKNYLIDNRVSLRVHTDEYNSIVYEILSKSIAKFRSKAFKGRIKDYMVKLLNE